MVQTSGWSKVHKRLRTSSQRALSHGLIFILHSRTIHVALIDGKDVLILMTLNNLAISDTVCIMYLMNVCVITLIKIFYSLLSSRFQHKFALVWKPVLYTPVDENFPINRTPTPSAEAVLSSCMRTTMGELQGWFEMISGPTAKGMAELNRSLYSYTCCRLDLEFSSDFPLSYLLLALPLGHSASWLQWTE